MSTVHEDNRVGTAAEKLWLKVLKDFDNETAHHAFIDFCTATRQLPLAGEKYRTYREQKGESPLIDRCMKRIVLSAQVSYLSDGQKARAAQHSPFTRLLTAVLFLLSGVIIAGLFVSFPDARVSIFMGAAMLVAVGVYQIRRKR